MPESLRTLLQSQPICPNFHDNCFSVKNFTKYKLDEFYEILSVTKSQKGQIFISSVEAKEFPFYGLQWHPEKNVFEWNESQKLSRISEARAVLQYFANFFVDEAKKNEHFMADDEAEKHLIYNYSPIYTGANGTSTTEQTYFFD